jgi:hypothetical protein
MTSVDNKPSHPFSITAYGDLLAALIERGYRVVSYAEASPSEQHLILRHDVDFDLDAALRMAEMEAERGLVSNYFVLLRTEFYNIFSRKGTNALQHLAALGHDVGLHFDPAFHDAEDADLHRAATAECDLLATVTGKPVKTFSLHRPPRNLLANSLEIPGRINAYAGRYFTEMAYCSDSRGAWHYGHPLEQDAVAQGTALQLLTHPMWWTHFDVASPQMRIEQFLQRRHALIDSEAAANCDIFKRVTGEAVRPSED